MSSHIPLTYRPAPCWMLPPASPGMTLWLNACVNPTGSVSKTHCPHLLDVVVHYFSLQPYVWRKFLLWQLVACTQERPGWTSGTNCPWPGPGNSLFTVGEEAPPTYTCLPHQSLDSQRLFSLASGQACLLPFLTADGWANSSCLFS